MSSCLLLVTVYCCYRPLTCCIATAKCFAVCCRRGNFSNESNPDLESNRANEHSNPLMRQLTRINRATRPSVPPPSPPPELRSRAAGTGVSRPQSRQLYQNIRIADLVTDDQPPPYIHNDLT